MKQETFGEIEIYAVGLLADLSGFVHDHDRVRARRDLRHRLHYPLGLTRAGSWREVRNYLAGYLCEPTPWPSGLTRCGHGWTRGRAYRDLLRRARDARVT